MPLPNNDFYEVYETLNAEELTTVKRVRAFEVGARVHEGGRARHHRILGKRRLSLRRIAHCNKADTENGKGLAYRVGLLPPDQPSAAAAE